MKRSFCTAGLLSLALGCAAIGAAQAPFTRPVDAGRRVFIDVNRVAPIEVLRELAPVISVRLEPSPDLPVAPVTLRLWNVRARTALNALCEMVGCRWQIEGRTLRVVPGDPPPPVPRSAEFFARLKQPLEGEQWKFVRVPLREVAKALAGAVGEQVVFEGAASDTPITADLTGQTPFRAVFRVMEIIGWDIRGINWEGTSGPGQPIVLRLKGQKDPDAAPAPRPEGDRAYEKDEPGLTMPRALAMAKPSYTRAALDAKIEGVVVVSAVVGRDGTLGELKVVAPLDPDLDSEALRAAREWRFAPGMKDGKPVAVRVTLELTFALR
jgi:TonB family protein